MDTPPVPSSTPLQRYKLLLIFILISAVLVAVILWFTSSRVSAPAEKGGGRRGSRDNGPVPIVPGVAQKKDLPIYLDGIGTVQGLNTVTIRPRVDGQLIKVNFTEGQEVKTGDVLAQIDPLPFKAQLDQVVAKKNQDDAQLSNARVDLNRYVDMVAKNVIAHQQYDTQKAMVAQIEAVVKTDQAAIDGAQVQLNYATITSPINGRAGIRLVDEGNMVRASDTNGLVVITQLQPISVVFTLPEQSLKEIHGKMGPGQITVFAMDRDNSTVLGKGTLTVIDNQIDISTGTIRLKATFPNEDLQLWPGEFVNVRLLLTTRKDAIVVPVPVIQHGPNGTYAFVIKEDQTVEIRPLKVGQVDGGEALVEEGLQAGEQVVVEGQYKLQKGSKVILPGAQGDAAKPSGSRRSKKS